VRSRVNWAVLGLVIERPSYGYELSQRFERRFGDVLDVQRSHIYAALNALQQELMIEPLPLPPDAHLQRQPKIHYRATAKGASAFRAWLSGQLREDPSQTALLERLVATGVGRTQVMLEILDRYEHACFEEAGKLPLTDRGATAGESCPNGDELMRRLVIEARRYALESQLMWLEYARKEIRAFAALREDAGRRQ
jgi:DNA-binding PadR family transcriptional regulator